MTAFAIVRDLDALQPACDAISELLQIRAGRQPGADAEEFLGFWVGQQVEEQRPGKRNFESILIGGRPVNMLNSCGVDGFWTLVWLPHDTPTTRLSLLRALHGGSAYGCSVVVPRCFVPVFRSDASPSVVELEMSGLSALFAPSLLPPSYQDGRSGRLFLPPVYREGPIGIH